MCSTLNGIIILNLKNCKEALKILEVQLLYAEMLIRKAVMTSVTHNLPCTGTYVPIGSLHTT